MYVANITGSSEVCLVYYNDLLTDLQPHSTPTWQAVEPMRHWCCCGLVAEKSVWTTRNSPRFGSHSNRDCSHRRDNRGLVYLEPRAREYHRVDFHWTLLT